MSGFSNTDFNILGGLSIQGKRRKVRDATKKIYSSKQKGTTMLKRKE